MKCFWTLPNFEAEGAGAGASLGLLGAAQAVVGASGGELSGAAGAGGGVSGGAASGAGGEPAPDAGAADPAAPPAVYHPDGMPDQFKGASDREVIDRLYKNFSERPQAPASADQYTFTPPPELATVIDAENDPVLPLYRDIALEMGLSQAQFEGTISKLYARMGEAGMLPPRIEPETEFLKLGAGAGDRNAQLQRGVQRVTAAGDQIAALETRGDLSKEEAGWWREQLTSSTAVSAVEKLFGKLPSEFGLRSGGQAGTPSRVTEGDIERRMADPRYDALGPQFDRAFYDETRRLAQRVS